MPKGRPRKPVALKLLDGTHRPDKDGPVCEQVQAGGAPLAPKHLLGEALAFWNDVVPGLVAMGVAAACDAPALALMCEWWARYRRFSEDLDNHAVPASKVYQTTVMVGIATTNFDRLAARFGLTPSDRAKLRVEAKQKGGVKARKRV